MTLFQHRLPVPAEDCEAERIVGMRARWVVVYQTPRKPTVAQALGLGRGTMYTRTAFDVWFTGDGAEEVERLFRALAKVSRVEVVNILHIYARLPKPGAAPPGQGSVALLAL